MAAPSRAIARVCLRWSASPVGSEGAATSCRGRWSVLVFGKGAGYVQHGVFAGISDEGCGKGLQRAWPKRVVRRLSVPGPILISHRQQLLQTLAGRGQSADGSPPEGDDHQCLVWVRDIGSATGSARHVLKLQF